MLETFLGVLASFALWFGAQKWYRTQKEKKAKLNMSKELKEEIQLNIGMLDKLIEGIPKEIERENIPVLIPFKLKLQVYDYIIKSGDIRLFGDFSKQRRIRIIGYICEGFNHFIDNTENLLATLTLKSNSLSLVYLRLGNLVDQAKSTRNELLNLFNRLHLDHDTAEEDMSLTNNNSHNGQSNSFSRIENHLIEIKQQLKEADKTAKYYFRFSLGFTALAIGAALALVPAGVVIANVSPKMISLLVVSFALAILLASRHEYRPQYYHKKLLNAGITVMFSGVGVVLAASFLGLTALPYQSLAGLLTFLTGYLISTIFALRLKQGGK